MRVCNSSLASAVSVEKKLPGASKQRLEMYGFTSVIWRANRIISASPNQSQKNGYTNSTLRRDGIASASLLRFRAIPNRFGTGLKTLAFRRDLAEPTGRRRLSLEAVGRIRFSERNMTSQRDPSFGRTRSLTGACRGERTILIPVSAAKTVPIGKAESRRNAKRSTRVASGGVHQQSYGSETAVPASGAGRKERREMHSTFIT